MKKTTAFIGTALLAMATTGIISARGKEPPAPGSTVDYSNQSAPKTIQSKEITSFSYRFEEMGRVPTVKSRGGDFVRVDDDSGFQGRCHLKLARNGENADFSASCSADSDKPLQVSGTVGKEALYELQSIIDKHDVARLNGFYKRNSALGCSFDLRVQYASGESISANGEGGLSVLPDGGLPNDDFRRFFQKLIQQSGQNIPGGIPPANTINHFALAFTNNVPVENFPAGHYLLQYLQIENREYAYASFEPVGSSTPKTVFKTDFKKQEVQALQSLIDRENLTALSGYTNRKPELGNQKFHLEIAFQNRLLLRAEAVGDESVLPAEHWNGGRDFVRFFQQAASKRGKTFP